MDIFNIDTEHVRRIVEDGERMIVYFRSRPGGVVIASLLKAAVKQFSIEYCGEGGDFESLLYQFNNVLEARGIPRRIGNDSTPSTYAYLYAAWSRAMAEWEDPDSPLFDPETYPEIYDGTDYHGSNTDYHEVARIAMVSWLMAMCLSELVPSRAAQGEFTNNQTELFRFAYNYPDAQGDGRNIPLYGGFEIHSDPMIARIAGGAVYAVERGHRTFDQMELMRKEIYGDSTNHWIEATDWDDLGASRNTLNYNKYSFTDNRDTPLNVNGNTLSLTYECFMRSLGYLVNSDIIIPSDPGPFVDDHSTDWNGIINSSYISGMHIVDKKTGGVFPTGQPVSLFNATTKNYDVDEKIDRLVVQDYNIGKATPFNEFNGYAAAKKNLIIAATAADSWTDEFVFGGKKNVQCAQSTQVVDGTTQYNYAFSEGGDGTLYIEGPFPELAGIYQRGDTLDGSGYTTRNGTIHQFLDDGLKMFDNSRYPTYHNRFGRRRPCMGRTRATPRHWTGNLLNSFSKENALYNGSLSSIVADSASSAASYLTNSELVCEQPKSYPSGHTAQAWGMAMLLGQMHADTDETKIYDLMTRAYKVGVYRTITRYHWNSDTIYGRLFATMMLPLMNAMHGFMANYDTVKDAVAGGSGTTGTMNLTIVNNTGNALTVDNRGFFYVRWPGNVHNGVYFYLSNPRANITIPSGSSEWNGIRFEGNSSEPIIGAPIGRQANDKVKMYASVSEHVNIVDKGWASSLTLYPVSGEEDTLREGGSYVLTINA